MTDPNLIYDAMAMPVADPGMINVAIFASITCSALAVIGWLGLRKPSKRRSSEAVGKEMMGRGVITLMALSALGYLLYAGLETALWRYNYAHQGFHVLDGCVTAFRERVQSDHDLGVDTFALGGHVFTLSDSGWRLGYHLSHHHGSPIQDRSHLRVFAHGPQLLRIELANPAC